MTGKFLTSLEVRSIDDSVWALSSPLVFNSKRIGLVTVPAGFVTDFASVPRVPVAYLLTGDAAHAPAVIHDYLYGSPRRKRSVCDAVFLEAMEDIGVAWWRRYLMWAAVRVFGGFVRSVNAYQK